MVQLSKSELIPLIVAHYRQQLQESTFHLYTFSQKYVCTFDEFEKRIHSREKESFDEWDDYIAWKGHIKAAQYLSSNIQKIEDGLFTLA